MSERYVDNLSHFCLLLFSFILGAVVTRIMFIQEWFGIDVIINHLFWGSASTQELLRLVGIILVIIVSPLVFFLAHSSYKSWGLSILQIEKMQSRQRWIRQAWVYIIGFAISSVPYPLFYIAHVIRGTISLEITPMLAISILWIFIPLIVIKKQKRKKF